jgi:hypothetical protein
MTRTTSRQCAKPSGSSPEYIKAGSSSDQFRELEAQRLPAFRPPALSDLPPLQHHVLPAALLQHRAHGQSRLTALDDNGVVVLSHTLLRRQLRIEPSVLAGGLAHEESLIGLAAIRVRSGSKRAANA